MQIGPDYGQVVGELLRLTGLGPGETSAVRGYVDFTTVPDEYADWVSDPHRPIDVLEIAGCYLPAEREVVLFQRVIADVAARRSLAYRDVLDVVLCHEVAHLVTHLGSGHGADTWLGFAAAPIAYKEFYAQAYAHYVLSGGQRPELARVLEALANDSPSVYQSYLRAMPCPVELMNELLYADRRGEKPRFTVEPSSVTGLDQLARDIVTKRPVTERQMLALRQSVFGPMRVGGVVVPFETLERVCKAKRGSG